MNPFASASLALLCAVSHAVAVQAKSKTSKPKSKAKSKISIALIIIIVIVVVLLLLIAAVAFCAFKLFRNRRRKTFPVKGEALSNIGGGGEQTADPEQVAFLHSPHTPAPQPPISYNQPEWRQDSPQPPQPQYAPAPSFPYAPTHA